MKKLVATSARIGLLIILVELVSIQSEVLGVDIGRNKNAPVESYTPRHEAFQNVVAGSTALYQNVEESNPVSQKVT